MTEKTQPKEKEYVVHLYPLTRIRVPGVKATSQTEAIKKAETMVDITDLIERGNDPDQGPFNAEEISYYMVDEVGDEEYANTRTYASDGVSPDYAIWPPEAVRLMKEALSLRGVPPKDPRWEKFSEEAKLFLANTGLIRRAELDTDDYGPGR